MALIPNQEWFPEEPRLNTGPSFDADPASATDPVFGGATGCDAGPEVTADAVASAGPEVTADPDECPLSVEDQETELLKLRLAAEGAELTARFETADRQKFLASIRAAAGQRQAAEIRTAKIARAKNFIRENGTLAQYSASAPAGHSAGTTAEHPAGTVPEYSAGTSTDATPGYGPIDMAQPTDPAACEAVSAGGHSTSTSTEAAPTRADAFGSSEFASSVPPMFTGGTWTDLQTMCPEITESLTQLTDLAGQLRSFDRPMGPEEAILIMDGIEALHRVVESLSISALSVFERVGTPDDFGAKTTRALVANRSHVSDREASRRIGLAQDLGARVDMCGQALEPKYPIVAEALHAGMLSTGQASVITSLLGRIPDRVSEDDRLRAEEVLVEHAPEVRVRDLYKLFDSIMAWADPDGDEPTEPGDRRHTFINLNPRRDGDWDLKGRLDAITGGVMHGLLTSRITAEGREDSTDTGNQDCTDTGTFAPSPHDNRPPFAADQEAGDGDRLDPAKEDPKGGCIVDEPDTSGYREDGAAIDTSAGMPSAGERIYERFATLIGRVEMNRAAAGAPFALVVTAKAEDLAKQTGRAESDAETTIPITTARNEGLGGTVFFHLMSEKTKTMQVRTEKRFANAKQIAVISSRDRGCTFPGCDTPPGWCDVHHSVPWSEGGKTDISNLLMACSFHHHLIDRSEWETRMLADGRPAWVPPGSVDPGRRPILHARFVADDIADTLFG